MSYLVESGFTWKTYLPSEVRNCLDVVKWHDLTLSLTALSKPCVYHTQGTCLI